MKKQIVVFILLCLLCACKHTSSSNNVNSSESSFTTNDSTYLPSISSNDSSSSENSSSAKSSNEQSSFDVEKKSFTIHYDLGNVKDAHIEALEQTVVKGESFNYYVPYHKDYIFNCWYLKNTTQKFNSGIYNYDEDIYLVANWSNYSHDSSWTSNY